jgi:hypothetical protein
MLQSQLLSISNIEPPSDALTTLRGAGYIGIVFNVSTAIGALISIDILGELPTRAWRKWKGGPPEMRHDMSDSELLALTGTDFRWSIVSVHFSMSFVLGSLCTAIQVGAAAWISLYTSSVRWLLIACLAWSSLPLVVYLFSSFLLGLLSP